MADINITLDATKAIRDVKKLNTAFNNLERKVKKLQSHMTVVFRGGITMTPRAVAGAANKIQALATARGKVKPIIFRAIVRLDKRTLKQSGIQTMHTRLEKQPLGKTFASSYDDYMKHAGLGPKPPRPKDPYDDSHLPLAERIDPQASGQGTPPGKDTPSDKIRKAASETYPKQTQQQIQQVKELNRVYDKIGKDVPASMSDIKNEYDHLKARTRGWMKEVKRGTMTQAQMNKKIAIATKEMKTLDKAMKKASRGGGLLSTTFGKLAVAATFIAATLFIFQKLKQYMTQLAQIGAEYVKTLADIQAQTGLTSVESEYLADTLKDVGKDSSLGLKDTYAAYKALTAAGLAHEDAMAKAATAAKIARNEQLKLADAAQIVGYGTAEMTEKYLKFNDAMEETAADAWKAMKRDIGEVIAQFYKSEQPMFVDWIKRLSDFATGALPYLLTGLKAAMFIFETIYTILKPFVITIQEIGKVLSTIPSLSSIFDLTKDVELPISGQIEIAERALNKMLGRVKKRTPQEFLPDIAFDVGDYSKAPPVVKDWHLKILPEFEPQDFEFFWQDFGKDAKRALEPIEFSMERLKLLAKSSKKEVAELAQGLIKLKIAASPDIASPMLETEAIKYHQEAFKKLGKTTTMLHWKAMQEIKQRQDKYKQASQTTLEAGDDIAAGQLKNFAAMVKVVDIYKQRQKELGPVFKDQKKFFDLVGISAEQYHKNRTTQLKMELYLMEIRHSLTPKELELYEAAKKFNNEQARLKPLMDGLAKSFALTGSMADAMYKNELDLIDEELRRMKLIHKDLDVEYEKRLKIKMLDRKKEAPLVKKHEAILEETGKETKYLGKTKLKYATDDYKDDILERTKAYEQGKITEERYRGYVENRTKQFMIKVLEMHRNKNAKILESEKKHFETTGILTSKYETLVFSNLKNLRAQALLANEGMEKEVHDTFNRMERDAAFELQAPKLSGYDKMYKTIKTMDNKHYNMKKERLDAEFNDLEDVLGKSTMLHEAYQRRLMALDIQRLQGTDEMLDGMKAGWERLYLETEPLAKMMADTWVSGFHSLEQSAKDLFSSIISGEQSLSESIANMGKALQKMLNELLFDIIKKGTFDQIYELMAKAGLGKKEAKSEVVQETTERIVLTSIIETQTASVLALAAAYRILNAAKGVGFSSYPGGGSGLGYGGSGPEAGYGFVRQHGGPVYPGKTYVVGEKGPEMLHMGSEGGKVIPFSKQAPPNVSVVVQNNTGVEADATVEQPTFDGERWVLNVVMDAYDRNKDGMRDIMGGK